MPPDPRRWDAIGAAIGPRCQRDVPLGPRTTYRVGGRAALLFEAADIDDLVGLAHVLNGLGGEVTTNDSLPVAVLGRGSNLLVADAGFDGLVVVLAGETFATITVTPEEADGRGDFRVWAGGAVSLPVLARQTAAAGLSGLEWAVGVPGSVGGAVRMNAGGHGADTRSSLTRCRLIDLVAATDETVAGAALDLGYRHSNLASHQIVAAAEYRLRRGSRVESEATIREILRWRREHQPGGQNAGSVFVNPQGDPPGNSAGWLVETAGFKGVRRGSAKVSAKHANFIQADPDGSADDVLALMIEVQQGVKERLGVVLKAETRLLGFPQHLVSTLGSDEGDS